MVSKALNEVLPLPSESTFVMAAVNVVLPWSTCPIVPTFMWGFDRSKACFAMGFPPILCYSGAHRRN